VPLLRGYPLAINPDGPVSAILPAELLIESANARSAGYPVGADPTSAGGLRGRHRAG
jgi:hypothetical protein